MKRFLRQKLALVFVLLLCALALPAMAVDFGPTPVPPGGTPPPATATDEIGFPYDMDDPGTMVRNAALTDNTFYAWMGDGTIKRWAPDEAAPATLCAIDLGDTAYAAVLAAGDGSVILLDSRTGRLARIEENGYAWLPIQADKAQLFHRSEQRGIKMAFIESGVLYALIDYDEECGSLPWNFAILSIDLQTGKTVTTKLQGTEAMTPYKPGSVLLLRSEQKDGTYRYKLSILQLGTGKVSDLLLSMPTFEPYTEESIGGLAYDAGSDTIYYAQGYALYASSRGAAFRQNASLALSYPPSCDTQAFAMPDGRYAIHQKGILLKKTTGAAAVQTLRVVSPQADHIYRSFIATNPDTAVSIHMQTLTAADIAKALTAGDNTNDIYEVTMDAGFTLLKEKGFLTPLNIQSTDLYPFLTDVLSDAEGSLLAYPKALTLGLWTYTPALWETYFGDTPRPATYGEWLDAMLVFETEFAAENPQHSFLEYFDYEDWVNSLITAYIRQYEQPNEALDFDNAALKDALETLAAVQRQRSLRSLTDPMEFYSELEAVPAYWLFSTFSALNLLSSTALEAEQLILPLTFQTGETPVVPARLSVLLINPHSTNKEAALQYIACAAGKDLDIVLYYSLHRSATEPVVSSKALEALQALEADRAGILQSLATAPAADRAAFEDMLAAVDFQIARYQQVKWRISPEGVAAYQATAPHIRFFEQSRLLGIAHEQIALITTRYCGGQMTVDTFVAELNRVCRMIERE